MSTPDSSYRKIPLTQGQVALVDADLYEFLNQWKWHAAWSEKTQSFYARRNGPQVGGRRSPWIYMHRLVLGLEHGDPHQGDHREPSETLDNRRANLRKSTGGQNRSNTRKRKNTASKFKGVCRSRQKWAAYITVGGKTIYLGVRDTEEAAHLELYVPAAEKYHGEFARMA
jgi:hypothetical protein